MTAPESIYVVELKSSLFGDTMHMPVLAESEEVAVQSALAVTFHREVISVRKKATA